MTTTATNTATATSAGAPSPARARSAPAEHDRAQVDAAGSLPRLAARLVAGLAAAKVVFHLATSRLYGLHRDEFYYLAGGHHLSWGYVDHPPLTPILYRVGEVLFGRSATGLHVLPALLGGLLVVVGALLAREFGGGRAAQGLTALVAAVGPLYLTPVHFLGTVTVDLLTWSIATLLVVRVVRTANVRLWPVVGAVVGIGLLNKHTVVFWVVGMLAGLLLTPQRRLLQTWWLAAGVAVAAALFAPNVVWQAQHRWATLEFLRHLQSGQANLGERTKFVVLQLAMVTPAAVGLWAGALRWMRRSADGRRWRWLAWAYALMFVVLLVLGGKSYYLGSIYLPLVAAGAALADRTWTRRGIRRMAAAVLATGVLFAPIFTPLVPASQLQSIGLLQANSDLGGMLGWPGVVHQIATTYRSLPGPERAHAVILTEDYSEAGAVDYWHSELGLPPAISGHNSYWWWGWRDARQDATTIAVGFPAGSLERFFGRCQPVAVLGGTGVLLDPQEQGRPILVCRDQRLPWPRLWPQLRHYD
jgi:Dolichyl-phosphate-mannose-protein mannosyltransferase